MRWVTVGPPHQPDTSIVLYPPNATPGITDEERRTIAEMMAKGSYGTLLLVTKDLDATFERLQACVQNGQGEVIQEPNDQPYGVRDCALRDPAGNLIRIQQVSQNHEQCNEEHRRADSRAGRLAGRHAGADPHAHQAGRSGRDRGMEVARRSSLVTRRNHLHR
ncbi:glyoxalase-like domain protein [Mycobacterium kansasii 732]|nr:glyoxalase-like domain protein [Mycobacterium kansasii 732]